MRHGRGPALRRREGGRAELRCQPAATCLAVGGVDPGGQHTASGGALRVRCDGEHRSVEVAGVDPASWRHQETVTLSPRQR
jgi:hypothetical protein